MRRHAVAALLVAALCVSVVHAGDDPLADATKKAADKSLWTRMAETLKLRIDEDKTAGTFFVPSDRAVRAFLKQMSLTEAQLLERPQLVDAIVSYHFIPGVSLKEFCGKTKASGTTISDNAKEPSLLLTGDVNNDLEAFCSPTTGLTTLIDAQGNRAQVLGKASYFGKVAFWDVSSVLMSGSYFYSARAAVRYWPEFKTAQELYQKASAASKALETSYVGTAAPYTFLVPTNDALAPVLSALTKAKAPVTDLASLLEYHVIAGIKPVPTGWKSGAAVPTLLKGHTITGKLSERPYTDPYDGKQRQGPVLELVPEASKPALVTTLNIYAGQSVLQGVDGALIPSGPVAKALGAAAKTGRHLLQGRGGGSGGSRGRRAQNNQWAAQNTQAAIRAAATGRVPASYATAAGSRNARASAGRCVNCLAWDRF